jgi:hypothetical protein
VIQAPSTPMIHRVGEKHRPHTIPAIPATTTRLPTTALFHWLLSHEISPNAAGDMMNHTPAATAITLIARASKIV